MGKPKAEPRLAENEALAYVKYIRTSPRKLNLVAQSIRGLSVEVALDRLAFSKKRVAEDVRKACSRRSRMRRTTTSSISTGWWWPRRRSGGRS